MRSKSTEKLMNSASNTAGNKRGSYMVEAAMSLPVFILVFVALALIVNIIASCEDLVFRECQTIYKIDMKAPQLFPNPKGKGYKVLDFDYLYSDGMTEDLISLDSLKEFKVENPIGILGEIKFKLNILSRGYTGYEDDSGPLDYEEFCDSEESEIVIIFPKYGIRFHTKGCRYVQQEYEGEEVKLEMEKRDAELKGYTPCLVCGGG